MRGTDRLSPSSVVVRAIALAALLVGGLPTVAASAAVGVRWTVIASGFNQPTQVTSAPDGSGRLFVVEKAGYVRSWRNGSTSGTPLLDIHTSVRTLGEGGLLSIVFNSDFTAHPYVFVAYTNTAGNLQIARYHFNGPSASSVEYFSKTTLLTIPHPTFSNHYGGQLIYQPATRTLVITTGDGGSGGDPPNNAQNLKVLLGKMLRINPWSRCGSLLYCIPSDNPFATSTTVRREIIEWGLRNPWRVSRDVATNYFWISDVGQDRYEEIDTAAPTAHYNFGWSCKEGNAVYRASRCNAAVSYKSPSATYSHSEGFAVVGGFIYRGAAFPALRAAYVFGDFGSGRIWTLTPAGRRLQPQTIPQLTSFGEGAGNELFAVSLDGKLWRLRFA